ncbi:MAG: HlyD family secretion protein [Coxiellaceae bacterium]|nr:MAG: HlyD family secretion protein [Coxiellaceae bacterium]
MENIKFKLTWIVASLILLVGICFGGYRWLQEYRYPISNVAYVQGISLPVSAKTSGRIASIYVQNNTLVKKGDILLLLDSTPAQLAIAQAEQTLAHLKQNIVQSRDAVNTAEKETEERQQELSELSRQVFQEQQLAASGQITSDQLLEYKEAYQAAGYALEEAYNKLSEAYQAYGPHGASNDKIAAAQAALNNAKQRLIDNRVIAPVDGYITDFNLKLGMRIAPKLPLFNIIENNQWWVEALFEPAVVARIKPKQLVIIRETNRPQRVIYGMIEEVTPKLPCQSESKFYPMTINCHYTLACP